MLSSRIHIQLEGTETRAGHNVTPRTRRGLEPGGTGWDSPVNAPVTGSLPDDEDQRGRVIGEHLSKSSDRSVRGTQLVCLSWNHWDHVKRDLIMCFNGYLGFTVW